MARTPLQILIRMLKIWNWLFLSQPACAKEKNDTGSSFQDLIGCGAAFIKDDDDVDDVMPLKE